MTRRGLLRRHLLSAALAVPGVLLLCFGFVHLRDGVAVDAAVPVPVYMVAQIDLPKGAYQEAAKALEKADRANGGAALAEAEARIHSGESAAVVLLLLRRGLSREPASARGWTLLAETLRTTSPATAAQSLSQAFLLAPRDYWIAGARAQDAAQMWSSLDAETRRMAMDQVDLLWRDPLLRPQLRQLSKTQSGAALITRTFSPDEVRAINRWLVSEQRLAL